MSPVPDNPGPEYPKKEDGFLELTAYATDPADGDWTDILLSAIRAGHRRIYMNDPRFAFAMYPRGRRTIVQPCELVFGPNHEVAWAGPSRGLRGAILAVRGAADVSILRPNIVGAPTMDVSGGRGANCHCFISGSRLAEPVVVIDGGEGYRDASGYPDGFFDYPALDVNNDNLPPRDTGVVRFEIAGGKIVGGSVVSSGEGYVERPRVGQAPALMLGAAFPGTSIYLSECKNPQVTDVRQTNGCGVIQVSGGSGARLCTGYARDIGSGGHGILIGPTTDVIVSGWNIKGVHGGIYHAAGISLIALRPASNEDPITAGVRITENVVDDVNAGSCFDAVVCGLSDIRFERNTAIQRRTGGFFCMQIKLGRPSRDPKNPGAGVCGVIYRDNKIMQNAPGGLAVDFQNNSNWDDFEVDFDRSNTIECIDKSDARRGSGTHSCGLRAHNVTGGTIAPTIVFSAIGVRASGNARRAVFSPHILRCRLGILSYGDVQQPVMVRDADIHASEAGAMILSRGDHRLTDCKMVVQGYRLEEEAKIVSAGSGHTDGEWSVFAAGSGSGLALAIRVEDGRLAEVDLLSNGQDYLNNGGGEFLLDVPPDGNRGPGSGGVLAVRVAAGSAVSVRIVEPGESYLEGACGAYQPALPEHARLLATVRGGEVVSVEVLHCGWRFHRPPVLVLDPAAGRSDVSITIGLASRSFGAYFADADGPEISGGFYDGATGDIGVARDERPAPADPVDL